MGASRTTTKNATRPSMAHETVSLDQRIAHLVAQHGSLRKAGRVVGLTGQYLYRLQSGEKTNPSATVLRKLGLRRVVVYVRLTANDPSKYLTRSKLVQSKFAKVHL